jgi:pSer/pThr/pTyr-binding forkhead associated (FHA) protein
MVEDDARHQYALLVDPQTGQEYNLCRFATALGRSLSCDIVLTDKSVSRQHAVVYCLKGKFYIEDVGSTNGTTLNKKAVTARVPLMCGDELRIGTTPLLFLLIPDRNHVGVYFEPTPTHEVGEVTDPRQRVSASAAVKAR